MVTSSCGIYEIGFAQLEMITAICAASAGIHVDFFGSYAIKGLIDSESITRNAALVGVLSIVCRIFDVDDRAYE